MLSALMPGAGRGTRSPTPTSLQEDDVDIERDIPESPEPPNSRQGSPNKGSDVTSVLGSLTTSIDTEAVRAAYEDVRADTSDTEWAVFKFEDQIIVCSATGVGFEEFRSHFHDDERAFGFVRIQMGDEMSKRQKFVFITWVGPNVSVIKRAKMSIDKTMAKHIIKNFAVELQLESLCEMDVDYLREQLSRAGGVNYGTGISRDK